MDSNSFYDVLRQGSVADLRAMVHGLPPDRFRDLAAKIMSSEERSHNVAVLGGMTLNYCNGSSPELGRELALALHRLGKDLYDEAPSHHGLLATTLSSLANCYVRASNMLGKSEDAVRFAEAVIPYYAKIEPENLHSIKLGRIQALINLNRLSEADELLNDPELPGNPVTDMEYDRLRKQVDKLMGAVTEARPSEGPVSGKMSDESVALIQSALSKLASESGLSEDVIGAIQGLASSPRLDASVPQDHARLLDLLRQGESLLLRGSTGDSEISVRQRIRDATGIFMAFKSPPDAALKKSLAALQQALGWADANNLVELQNDALWGIYLCHSRLKDMSAGADALIRLRANLETTRAGIVDVTRRAGAFSQFNYLFAASCEKLYRANRIEEMFEAIEASKGRAVADLLTQRANRPVADSDVYSAARAIPALCRAHKFHYLTFFVDDDVTYAVFVSSSGQMHAPEPSPLGRAAIRDAAVPVTADSAARLAPLLGFLTALMIDGSVRPDDHLCVSADEDLANVPFGCLPLAGRLLADFLTTSRIHNAWHLAHVLERPVARPRGYLGVVVPSSQNVTANGWGAMRASMRKPIERLARLLPGESLEGAAASRAALATRDLRGRVVHFSTHGMFPGDEPGLTPFADSGLLLGDGQQLPDVNAIKTDSVLTPRAVLDDNLNLSESHASLMACVSGLSREGIGGDALGMEWALLQAGATSVLSTHWNVSASMAGTFLDLFYEEWLQRELSRAQAWRGTIATLRGAGGSPASMESWAAFTLTGDWR